jgi:orotidine-5'-phosphate decarboxylase
MIPKFRIAVALDNMSCEAALELMKLLEGTPDILHYIWGAKGTDLFDLVDPAWFRSFCEHRNVWVDFKVHDTPQTAANRARKWALGGACAMSLHASGGINMMRAAKEATAHVNNGQMKLIAVTVLTSLQSDADREKDESVQIFGNTATNKVVQFAKYAVEAGMWGIVCSPEEVGLIAGDIEFDTLTKLVPGIRLPGSSPGVQKRMSTPGVALQRKTNILVVGSDITTAEDPVEAVRRIIQNAEGRD